MRTSFLATGLMAAMAFVSPAWAQELKVPEGFRPLFNGKDLAGWHGWAIHEKGANPYEVAKASPDDRKAKIAKWTEDAKKHWSVEPEKQTVEQVTSQRASAKPSKVGLIRNFLNRVKGKKNHTNESATQPETFSRTSIVPAELVNDGEGAYLATEKEFGDIELMIDFKTVAKADSGIYLRATPQVQIWDYTDPAKFGLGANKGSGGLWNNSKDAQGKDPSELADKPFGEWNHFHIRQIGDKTWIKLNGKLVVNGARMENFWDRKLPLLKQGKILLQTHGGEIRWRNIFVREIPAEEANSILAAEGNGFKNAFDGATLNGWVGAVDNYEVRDGAIVCKPGKGGVLHTPDKYADFVVRLEYKLPPGGNNGLAIRYPGNGDTAYTGMCELQVLDDTSDKYAKLDPRQYNLSAYGMTAVNRGYLRPVGQWNYAEVTVKGSTIVAELNGNRVLDTDLSKVTDYMAKTPHPGKDNKEGFFGFAGHGDAVSFRNVSIKRLP